MPIDWDKVSTSDLQAIQRKEWDKVSTNTLQLLQQEHGQQPPTASNEPAPTPTPTPPPGTQRTVPQAIWDGVKGVVKPMVRPALEMGGAVGGGVLGGVGTMNPVGAIAGAGLGFAAGRTVADKVEGVTPTDPLQMAARTGKAFVEGTTMEAGGQALSKGINKIGGAVANTDWAKRLYGGAVKTPTGQKWDRLYKGEELTNRQKLIDAGLKDEVLPNNFGMQKARAKVNEITDKINNVVNQLTGKIQSIPFVKDALSETHKKATASGVDAVGVVNKFESENISKSGYKREFTPQQLHALKVQLSEEIEWDAKSAIVNTKSQFTQKAKKAMVDACIRRLEEMSPEIKYLNPQSAARLDLIRAIEHTINREMSKDAIGFSSKLLALKSFGLGILDATLRVPTNKARLAFAIQKGGKWAAPTMSKMAGYTGIPQILHFDEQGNLMEGQQ